MWLPVLSTSTPDSNGMMVASKSHIQHEQFINNGSWNKHQGSLSGHVELMKFWRRLGDSCPTLYPTLELGDVLVMNKVKAFKFCFVLMH